MEADQAVEGLRDVTIRRAGHEEVRRSDDLGLVISGSGKGGREEEEAAAAGRAGVRLAGQRDDELGMAGGMGQVGADEARVGDEGAPVGGDAPEPAQPFHGHPLEDLDQQVLGDDDAPSFLVRRVLALLSSFFLTFLPLWLAGEWRAGWATQQECFI